MAANPGPLRAQDGGEPAPRPKARTSSLGWATSPRGGSADAPAGRCGRETRPQPAAGWAAGKRLQEDAGSAAPREAEDPAPGLPPGLPGPGLVWTPPGVGESDRPLPAALHRALVELSAPRGDQPPAGAGSARASPARGAQPTPPGRPQQAGHRAAHAPEAPRCQCRFLRCTPPLPLLTRSLREEGALAPQDVLETLS